MNAKDLAKTITSRSIDEELAVVDTITDTGIARRDILLDKAMAVINSPNLSPDTVASDSETLSAFSSMVSTAAALIKGNDDVVIKRTGLKLKHKDAEAAHATQEIIRQHIIDATNARKSPEAQSVSVAEYTARVKAASEALGDAAILPGELRMDPTDMS